jgi:hypothetical protein
VGIVPDATDKPGNALLYIAVSLFVLGLMAVAGIFLVPAVSDREPGLPLYLTALAAPVGFLVALIFTLRSGRRARR